MMNDKSIRQIVKRMYPNSLKWAAKVDKMSAEQVYQIHVRQCRIEDEAAELRKQKDLMYEALVNESSVKDEFYLQGCLF